MPLQAPGPGHAWRTTSNRCSSSILPTVNAPERGTETQRSGSRATMCTRGNFTERLERVGDVHRVALFVAQGGAVLVADAGLDRPAVHEDGGAVVPNGGHRAPGHIFVAAGDGDIGVVVLGLREHR